MPAISHRLGLEIGSKPRSGTVKPFTVVFSYRWTGMYSSTEISLMLDSRVSKKKFLIVLRSLLYQSATDPIII